MPNDRPSISIVIRRQVLFEARHHCAVCCSPLPLEQAHVIPWSESQEHGVANLIAMCANCHGRADTEKWGAKTLRQYKRNPCILARKTNVPEGTNAHLVQLIDMLVRQEVTEMAERSAELASKVGAYTGAPGQVKVVSVDPANSTRFVLQLPSDAARKLILGFEWNDPLLLSFMDDIELLAVEPLSDRSCTGKAHADSPPRGQSSDLTFITNEPGANMRDRFGILVGKDTRFFDCLVGYFFISGFHKLYPALTKTEKIRILIGIKTDRATYDLIQTAKDQQQFVLESHAEVRERLPSEILGEFQKSGDSSDIEEGVRKFVEWIKSGKLEVRAYPSERLHAKLYVMTFHEGDRDKGRVITGSSNFTEAGLQDNLEFNVELKNRSDYEFAIQKFNELWAKAVDVTKDYVTTIEVKSPYAQFTPYELYLKFLYEYFRGELNLPDEIEDVYLPTGFKKLKYQEEAVLNARKVLDEYGGAFLSDVVGLGKTFMSALLAQHLNEPCLVIAPPHLLDEHNPGSWPNVFREFGVRGYLCESLGKLESLLDRDLAKFTTVFIDESHRFRTEDTQSYEMLAQICRGKRVVLVSATPLNNTPQDILTQIKLFQPGKNSTIPNVRNLEAFFGALQRKLKGLDRQRDREVFFRTVQENARQTREKILKFLMIRRTRSEIEKYYGEDLRKQGLKFPEVANPEPLFYKFNKTENEVFNETIRSLTHDLKYARYTPLLYYTGDRDVQEEQSQRNLAKFMKILTVKRLESSFTAFLSTLGRFIHTYERVIAEYHKGHVFISKEYIGKIFELLESDDQEGIERLLAEEKAEKLSAKDFLPSFIADLENDLKALNSIRTHWKKVTRDPKWESFRDILKKTPQLKTGKLIIFTESKETADYLAGKIRAEVESKTLLFTGESLKTVREDVIANFDARAFRPKDEYRILVATEVLAEGVNLHRSNVVINYDIPWNPTRLIQRVGRVNRVDTRFDTIHTYNFFPTEEGNDLIKLREAAEAKIHAFIQMLGADARLLTDGEEIVSHDLFAKWNSKKTITGEDEDEETELKFLTEIRTVRDKQPTVFERIKRLPKKARSTRLMAAPGTDPSGKVLPATGATTAVTALPALLTYFRQGKLDKFFLSAHGKQPGVELDFMSAAKILKPADTGEPRQSIPREFYDLLDRNKAAFVLATIADAEQAASTHRGSPNDAYILKRLTDRAVRRCPQFTEDDEEFVGNVIRLLEDGALPKPTAKKVAGALKKDVEPLKVLAILRRDIKREFFQPSPAAHANQAFMPREVILSSYLLAPT
jgi:superfamily II DNA or RNA helicase